MSTLTAAAWVAAFLLIIAGSRKVTAPQTAAAALRTAGLPSDRRLVRVLGVGEVVLGLGVLAVGGTAAAALLAVAYSGFAAFAQRQRRDGADCGCFGASRASVTAAHVWLNGVLAAGALGTAVLPGRAAPLTDLAASQPAAAAAAALLVAIAANLLRLLLTAAPELSATVALVSPDAAA